MADSSRRFGQEVLSVVLGAVIGGIATFAFQSVATTRDRAASQREARRVAATQAFLETARLMDMRLYRMGRYQQAERRRDADSVQWRLRYDSVTQAWHERLPTNSAILCHYFGSGRGADLQRISRDFSMARVAHRAHMASAARDGLDDDTDTLRVQIYQFELSLADLLRSGDILEGDASTRTCVPLVPAAPGDPSPAQFDTNATRSIR
jgi:hypothetical protein